MKKLVYANLLLIFFIKNCLACSQHEGGGFLPKNNLYIPVNSVANSGIDQQTFNNVLDKIKEYYEPIFQEFGANLVINRKWQDGTVNAYAEQQGNQWLITMFGGLARHHTTTPDSFALVACHEIGHHLAGVPKYSNSWGATEGQSDYFSTLKCLRRIFAEDDNENIVKELNVPRIVIQSCENSFGTLNEQFICQRNAMAGYHAANLFASMSGIIIDFSKPDPEKVSTTFESHPKAQCRLDTYFQGSICPVDEDIDIGQTKPEEGTCHQKNGDTFGLRPQCWFKPSGISPTPSPTPTPPPQPTPHPSPTPLPESGVAKSPLLNGQSNLTIRNPYEVIQISYDVSLFKNAFGAAIEFSKPNQVFTNPNSTIPDHISGLGVLSNPGTIGSIYIQPVRQLPGWGIYQIRIIPLSRDGKAVGKFSNSSSFKILK